MLVAVQVFGLFPKPVVSLTDYKSQIIHSDLLTWKSKPLHGQFPTQIEAITTVPCAYKRLCTSKLKIETEVLLVAAQDQALNTRAYSSTILHMPLSPSCRLCNGANETIFHLLSACPYLAGTHYIQSHNSVASLLHRVICSHFGFPTCEKPWLYVPQLVIKSKDVKILWDFEVRTDCVISA